MKAPYVFALAAAAAILTGHAGMGAPPDEKVIVTPRSGNRGYLGVSIQDMTRTLSRAMKVKTEEGALVTEVLEESPAERAGFKDDDIIVEFAGTKITDSDGLRAAVRAVKPGTTVTAGVVRKDEKKQLSVTVGKSPRGLALVVPPPPAPPSPHLFSFLGTDSEIMGLSLMELTTQLGEYFQAPGGRGVLVKEVEQESPAGKAGLKAGDVLTSVGGSSIEDLRDLRRALRDRDKGEKVEVGIVRRGAKQTLSLTVEESDDASGLGYWYGGPNARERMQLHLEGLEELDGLDDLDNEVHRLKLELETLNDEL